MDVNKVWLSGLAITQPILTRLASKTPFSVFSLQINEQFLDRNQRPQTHANIIRVESLGRSAELTAKKVKQGLRYMVDGYIRHDVRDGTEEIRVRTFSIYKEETSDAFNYCEGLKQALEVLRRSPSIDVAVKTLEDIIHSS